MFSLSGHLQLLLMPMVTTPEYTKPLA